MEFLSIKEVCQRIGVSRTTLWQLEKEEAGFPRLVPVTAKRKAFVRSEIDSWIASRIAARDGGRAR
ncbi:helix-turn-helix transcriptional regulator [Consotaella salsifontis]|uniref:Transcriptional regulator, AlpA family n=1 Tax=Consotaella salsifontis TaxID=1365950 RepID=A0A1T4R524_9HYPH|nr:AlpA family phage regulatory protein [Consotaella salsifontis]SKA11174.1 transcriptional regulator, AlpA family [Consotaella salsifontis]